MPVSTVVMSKYVRLLDLSLAPRHYHRSIRSAASFDTYVQLCHTSVAGAAKGRILTLLEPSLGTMVGLTNKTYRWHECFSVICNETSGSERSDTEIRQAVQILKQ